MVTRLLARALWALLLAAAVSPRASARAQARAPAAARRPNVLLILVDDWGWGDLGAYGNEEIRTPHVDTLARQGTLFTRFYVANPVCSPSRAAFLTGRFPARDRIHGHLATPELNARRGMPNYLDPRVPTVTGLMQRAGYATGHFGKWHLGSGPGAPLPAAYGIDRAVTHASNDSAGGRALLGGPGKRARLAAAVVDTAIRFIEAHRDRPFYANVWLFDVHAPLLPDDEQLAAYPGRRGPSSIYYAAATDADRHVGRLLRRLDELGVAENTLVVFSSDNGPEDAAIWEAQHTAAGSTGPFRGRKRSLYEGGVRVPFIVRWPGRAPAGRVDDSTVVGAVDFLPTVLAAAGVPRPAGLAIDGQSVLPAFEGRPVVRATPLYWEWRYRVFGHPMNRSPMLAMRDGRYKLLMNPDRSRVELYDVPADPSEVDNVADRHPDLAARMAARLLAWQRTLPPGPVDEVAGTNAYPAPKGSP